MGVYGLVYRFVRVVVRLGLVVLLVACSADPGQEEATVRPTVERTPVPPELTVCGVVTASQVGEVLRQDIIRYSYSNKIMAPKDANPTPEYTCGIKLGEGQYRWVRITYQSGSGRLAGSFLKRSDVTKHTTYEDIAAEDSARPLLLDGIDGQGVTVQDTDGYASGAAWRYPDGNVLTVGIDATEDGPRDNPDDVKAAADLAQKVVPAVPDLAAAGDSQGEWLEYSGTQYVNGTPAAELNKTPTPTPTPISTLTP
jgi:hypothetical protein